MSDHPVIELREVSFAYGDQLILENVSLAIGARESVCLVGPNGGGKTTLLKLILGLLAPKTGTIEVLGQTPTQARRRVGYMPQTLPFDPLFPISALDVVLMGRLDHVRWGFYSRADRVKALAYLDEVGLADQASHRFATMSGGQRQRVLIARALAAEPELLLLDEPTAMIDAAAEDQLLEKLRLLHERMTLVLVSHDLGFVSQLVQTVICVNRTVAIHPTSKLGGEVIREIYGTDLLMVRHDHNCADHNHTPGHAHTHTP
ncbi:MAG: ATP-binding cassette domain-containing protein [Verrucomicrobiota bacterium]|nr:ATP-binding cassette domain-containing protein [Verrucomicrobiota bacterium]